jgi:hypothetical protein
VDTKLQCHLRSSFSLILCLASTTSQSRGLGAKKRKKQVNDVLKVLFTCYNSLCFESSREFSGMIASPASTKSSIKNGLPVVGHLEPVTSLLHKARRFVYSWWGPNK